MTSAVLSKSNLLVCTLPSCILQRGFESWVRGRCCSYGDGASMTWKVCDHLGLQVCHVTSWEKTFGIAEPSLPGMRCIYLIHPYTPFSIFLHICYPWSQLIVSLSYCKAGRENCAAKHHLYPLVIWTSFVLLTVHPHMFSDASHKSMRLVMHSAAMPEALLYAHVTAHGGKLHVLFWFIFFDILLHLLCKCAQT